MVFRHFLDTFHEIGSVHALVLFDRYIERGVVGLNVGTDGVEVTFDKVGKISCLRRVSGCIHMQVGTTYIPVLVIYVKEPVRSSVRTKPYVYGLPCSLEEVSTDGLVYDDEGVFLCCLSPQELFAGPCSDGMCWHGCCRRGEAMHSHFQRSGKELYQITLRNAAWSSSYPDEQVRGGGGRCSLYSDSLVSVASHPPIHHGTRPTHLRRPTRPDQRGKHTTATPNCPCHSRPLRQQLSASMPSSHGWVGQTISRPR